MTGYIYFDKNWRRYIKPTDREVIKISINILTNLIKVPENVHFCFFSTLLNLISLLIKAILWKIYFCKLPLACVLLKVAQLCLCSLVIIFHVNCRAFFHPPSHAVYNTDCSWGFPKWSGHFQSECGEKIYVLKQTICLLR